jgi:cytochrome c oxidase subunit 4
MSEEQVSHPYYKVFAWLTALTIAEIAWGLYVQEPRFLLIAGLSILAAIKAAMVGLYYMHLRWDRPFNGVVFLGAFLFLFLFIGIAMMDTREYHDTMIPGFATGVGSAAAGGE